MKKWKITDKEGINCLNVAKVAIGWFIPQLKIWSADLNYNFDVVGLLKCPITNCPITTWQVNLRKIGFCFKPITIDFIEIFMIILQSPFLCLTNQLQMIVVQLQGMMIKMMMLITKIHYKALFPNSSAHLGQNNKFFCL